MLNMSSASNVSWFETVTIISGVVVGIIAACIKMFVKKPDNEKEHVGFIRVHTGIHETLTELRQTPIELKYYNFTMESISWMGCPCVNLH